MSEFTALQDLPDVLEGMGLNVLVADDWLYGQGDYLWTDPHTGIQSYDGHPWAYMVHHSGSTAATPPPHDTSKANAWGGLLRDGRLYQEGSGVPTIYLASAGPARTSSGYGYRPAAWDYTFREHRAPPHAQGPDGGTALNRYAFNIETVHAGDGSPIDSGVLGCVNGLGVALEEMFGLSEMTLGHTSWTKRKIDPYWNGDSDCIIKVQDAVKSGNMEDDMEWSDIVSDGTWTQAWEDGFIDGDPNVMPQYYWADGPATESEKKNGYNTIMQAQMERTKK